MTFQGVDYTLNQHEGSVYDWFGESKVGEYTMCYVGYLFHTAHGFVQAYRNNLNNYWRV